MTEFEAIPLSEKGDMYFIEHKSILIEQKYRMTKTHVIKVINSARL